MKTYLIIAAAMLLAGCSEKKAALNNDSADQAVLPETKISEDNADSIDAVINASDVANNRTFNGIIMVSPQQKATLSLTMGGRIHSLSIMQ